MRACRRPDLVAQTAGSAPPLVAILREDGNLLPRIAWATAVFVVFSAVAVAMGRSAARDLRDGVEDRDGVNVVTGLQALVPTLLAAAVALVCPILILMRT